MLRNCILLSGIFVLSACGNPAQTAEAAKDNPQSVTFWANGMNEANDRMTSARRPPGGEPRSKHPNMNWYNDAGEKEDAAHTAALEAEQAKPASWKKAEEDEPTQDEETE